MDIRKPKTMIMIALLKDQQVINIFIAARPTGDSDE